MIGTTSRRDELWACASCNATKKCVNYDLCSEKKPVKWFSGEGCYPCNIIFGKGIKISGIRDPAPEEECIICYSSDTKMMKFPAIDCVHHFCTKCCKDIIFEDERHYYVDPTLYGCPVCPKGCKNPQVGKQCQCEEYDEIQEAWALSWPDQYERWQEAEIKSVLADHSTDFYGKRMCPLCKRKIPIIARDSRYVFVPISLSWSQVEEAESMSNAQ